ncbi:H-NS histone family protein [Paraburkholderia caribensis]|uniref:H-NS histone family protein n=1 Tax=Paraburkholderia caribensis TaxID=75105 RepID=UPI001CB0C8D5|nr:H-NS histone family protein [Paraburkholderia caribensis]CAG9250724.1 putative DNA-binding protein HU homolog [Paraburkholderia caribensis]
MATLTQIESRIQKLQSQADTLRQKEAGKAIATIRKIMADYQLTVNDLDRVDEARRKPGRPAGKTATTSPAVKKKAVRALTKSGKVDGRKGPRPAMYRDPKTGATWSGWARPPAWIANVKDRAVFLIDKANGPSPGTGETKPVAKKAVKGATAGKKTVSKRATAKKIASKSSTAGSNAKIRTGAKAAATKTATGKRPAEKLAARKSLSAKGPATKKAARPQAGIEQVAPETTEIQSAE